MKIKGWQGRKRVEWVKVEHPFTALSPVTEVHANHNEAQNSALRRRSSADRRRQNLYAKRVEGLQRVLDVKIKLFHLVVCCSCLSLIESDSNHVFFSEK